jgi:hypothetical protein
MSGETPGRKAFSYRQAARYPRAMIQTAPHRPRKVTPVTNKVTPVTCKVTPKATHRARKATVLRRKATLSAPAALKATPFSLDRVNRVNPPQFWSEI